MVAAFLPRADARDALVLGRDVAAPAGLAALAPGTVVGTDSPRRTGFLLAANPGLRVVPLHGNVDSRLARLDRGEVDALVLAVAGLERLGRTDRITAVLAPDEMPPAPGQGALAVQVRRADAPGRDAALVALVAELDDAPTRTAVAAEREVLRVSGGGCRAPLGAFATVDGGTVHLLAGVVDPSGADARFARRFVPVSAALAAAAEVAMELGRA